MNAKAAGQGTLGGDVVYFDAGGTDPFFGASSLRDRGTAYRSGTGQAGGRTLDSRTDQVGGGVDGHADAGHIFQLGPDERLVVAGIYRYDFYTTRYGLDPASTPTFLRAGSLTQDSSTLAGTVRYEAGGSLLGLAGGGNWGSGTSRDPIAAATARFDTSGSFVAGTVGHTFALLGGGFGPNGLAPRVPGGEALGLNLQGYAGYAEDRVDSVTDSVGFTRGAEILRRGIAGGRARLFATTTWGRLTWSPYVQATLDSQFAFSHKLTVPAQVASSYDVVSFGGAQTFWGGGGGIDWVDQSGIRFGAGGYYRKSAQFEAAGGQVYVKFPISDWLSRTFASR